MNNEIKNTVAVNDYELINANNKREEPLANIVILVFCAILLAPIILGPLCALILYFGD